MADQLGFYWMLFLAQLGPILVYGITLDDCEDYQYLLNGGHHCLECPACPAGQTYTLHCGYHQDRHGKISKPRASCQPCESGFFKSESSVYECRECAIRCGRNREVVHPCNATHDLKCSDCKKGFYMENGSCYPCQHCCTKSAYTSQFRKEFVKDKCVRDGMGKCSCRSLHGCSKKCFLKRRSKTKHSKSSQVKIDPTPNAVFDVTALSARQLRKLLRSSRKNIIILLVKMRGKKRRLKKVKKNP